MHIEIRSAANEQEVYSYTYKHEALPADIQKIFTQIDDFYDYMQHPGIVYFE